LQNILNGEKTPSPYKTNPSTFKRGRWFFIFIKGQDPVACRVGISAKAGIQKQTECL
jgi:hypothetical protein